MDPAYRETGQMSYANGMFAWVDLDADQTSISLLHLKTGEKRRFTTDNRETLSFLRISDTLVAATSVRGYVFSQVYAEQGPLMLRQNRQCHVWDILTGDHKSFRLTSSGFDHFLTRGSKVMVSYEHCIIHFCFTTGKTRIIAAEGIICSSSLHGSEDMLSIIWLRRKLGQNSDRLSKAQHYLQVRKYAVVENTFISTQSRSKELPFEDYEYYEPDSRCITEAYQYQISSMIVPTNKSETHPIYLSLTADDRIAVHEVPVLPGSDEGMHVTWFDQSLVFTSLESRQLGESSYMNFGVARECLSNSGSSGTVFYKFDPVRLLPQLGLPSRLWAGDGFLLYLDQSGLRILVFDEDWYPSGVLQL
jgi:hypothetical protein